MKNLLNVVVLLLAVNFLAVLGGAAYLKQAGKLDRDKLMAIKEIIFPSTQPMAATTQPSEEDAAPTPTTQPIDQLTALLALQLNKPATEQVDFIRQSFDAQRIEAEHRERELADLQKQVDLARQQVTRDRTTLEQQRKDLEAHQQQTIALETDQGFQDSLALYKSMTGKQVKTIFLGLDDKTVSQYLKAMEPKTAARILKEFKSPQETAFVEKVLERIRKSQDAISPTTAPSNGAQASASSKE